MIGVWDGPEEARRVGEEAERLQREGASLSQLAILVRAQFQTREFEDRFIAIGLNYKIVGGFRFYERAEVRDALAYLRLIAQPHDDLAFERIYNTPRRGLGEKALQKIRFEATGSGTSMLEVLSYLQHDKTVPARARQSYAELALNFADWTSKSTDLAPAELLKLVLEESGYGAALKSEKSSEAAGRLENLAELALAMESYETLGDFLEHVSLVMDNDAADDVEKITIMTIHAAKGLEFDYLFLVGWEEGVFPSQRAMDEGGLAALEEERRLAYVAITRARRQCTILHAANRRIYGQWTSSIPSRFIADLPAAHVAQENTMSGGASLWRAQFSEHSDPFAHVANAQPSRIMTRGPGWQRASAQPFDPAPRRIAETTRSAASFAAKPRGDIEPGARVFHEKFGYGVVTAQEGNKLEIEFETAGPKRVIDSFVKLA